MQISDELAAICGQLVAGAGRWAACWRRQWPNVGSSAAIESDRAAALLPGLFCFLALGSSSETAAKIAHATGPSCPERLAVAAPRTAGQLWGASLQLELLVSVAGQQ